MPSTNLWGALPQVTEAQPTPLSILREQAEILTTATSGVLEGEVETLARAGRLGGKLNIIAPALGRYSVPIIEVSYDLMGYGVGIIISNLIEQTQRTCQDMTEYERILSFFLSSERVRYVIRQLLTQSNA